ncbi:hypothetical protein ACH0BF_20365 [Pseudobacillus sp. 179-B 2D1 NHS]|uniref:hypothetical protein n=1 Tax=Pseudobacillus sp. 179-B 2D1 NHS TaxID=3374292 RepID=UPI0038791F1D
MNSTLKDQLQQWKRKNQASEEIKPKKKRRKPQKRKEQPARKSQPLSESELRYLMGVNMQTLKRGRGGAFKR